MANMTDLACCPTPNCPYVFIWEAQGNHFACPVCEKSYCFACRGDWHPEFTCEEFAKINNTAFQDAAFGELAESKKYKQCPQCKFWVERSEGCDHMTCR
jgi:E3 ubiquitin-protein ligase RNF144